MKGMKGKKKRREEKEKSGTVKSKENKAVGKDRKKKDESVLESSS